MVGEENSFFVGDVVMTVPWKDRLVYSGIVEAVRIAGEFGDLLCTTKNA